MLSYEVMLFLFFFFFWLFSFDEIANWLQKQLQVFVYKLVSKDRSETTQKRMSFQIFKGNQKEREREDILDLHKVNNISKKK